MTSPNHPAGEPTPDQREAWERIRAIVEAAERDGVPTLRFGLTPPELRQLMAEALGAFFVDTVAPLLRLILDPAQAPQERWIVLQGWLDARAPGEAS